MIIIDGFEWNVPCDIERVAEVTPSEISGLMLDKTYFNDVIGTFLRYDVTLAVPTTMKDEYDSLYETLTDPVDAHSFVMPYGRSTVQITARVENVQDVLVYSTTRKQYWKGVKFSAIANHPTKKMELEEVLSVGVSPFPEAAEFPIGTIYEVTENGWEEVDYPDLDRVYY